MDPLITHDNEFLLRCALTYNWDALINFCSVILEALTSSAQDSEYELHQKRVSAAKAQLNKQDQWGNSALHMACYNNPPLRVVTSILNCASAASIQVHLVLTRDLSTPLNVACATGASTDVIRVLLDPPAGLDNGGIAVSIPDARGCTPLSELVIHYELQRTSPWYSRTALPLDQVDLIGQDIQEPLLESFWIKVELLMRSAWFVRHRRVAWISIVHGAAHVAESCPTVLTYLICRCYPAMTSFANRQGVLPIHLAVENEAEIQELTTHQVLPLAERRSLWIQQLVNVYPQGMSQPCHDERSVFCQAIASGLHWHVGPKIGPLQHLWNHAPQAVSTKDTHTGLYPFLLAATRTPASKDHTTAQMDTIYCLLRLYPQLLGGIVDTTEHQQYRCNKLIAKALSAPLGKHCQVY